MENALKKIIVTAPTSAVGGNLIKYLEGKYEIITVGRRKSDIFYDFSEDNKLSLPAGVKSIVHMAGILSAENDNEILNMVSTNVVGTLKLCIAARESGVKHIVFISSVNAGLAQNSPYYNYYAITKKQAEEIVRLYCIKNNIALCIIRPGQIFGVDRRFSKSQPLLYHMIESAIGNRPINIYGRHDALRNYIFADNLFRMIQYAVDNLIDEDVCAIDRKNYHLSEAAEIIIKAFQSHSEVHFLEEEADIADNAFYEERDFFSEWNIPFVEFRDAMKKIARLYKRK